MAEENQPVFYDASSGTLRDLIRFNGSFVMNMNANRYLIDDVDRARINADWEQIKKSRSKKLHIIFVNKINRREYTKILTLRTVNINRRGIEQQKVARVRTIPSLSYADMRHLARSYLYFARPNDERDLYPIVSNIKAALAWKAGTKELEAALMRIPEKYLPTEFNFDKVEEPIRTERRESGVIYRYYSGGDPENVRLRMFLHNERNNNRWRRMNYKWRDADKLQHIDTCVPGERLEFHVNVDRMRPGKDDPQRGDYGVDVRCDVDEWWTASRPASASCSVNRPVQMQINQYTVLRTKSSNDNCLIDAFIHIMKNVYHKFEEKIIAKSIRKLLSLTPSGPLNAGIDGEKLTAYFKCYTRIFIGDQTNPEYTFGDQANIYRVDILLCDNHFYPILKGAPIASGSGLQLALNTRELARHEPIRAPIVGKFDDSTHTRESLIDTIVADKFTRIFMFTGGAGTGKTHLFHNLAERLRAAGKRVKMCASTGNAAITLDPVAGRTVHSYMRELRRMKPAEFPHYILIDECSMLSAIYMNEIVEAADRVGAVLILSADVMQLPPVTSKHEGMFFQSDRLLSLSNVTTRYDLTRIYRADNVEFAELQNRMRLGKLTRADYAYLRSRVSNESADVYICAKKCTVEAQNNEALAHIQGETHVYSARVKSVDEDAPLDCSAIKKQIADLTLSAKVGAQVMIRHNIRTEQGNIYNGQLGTITACHADKIDVKMRDGKSITISYYATRDVVKKFEYEFEYMPIQISYALTIHKSQGQTIRGTCSVDLGDIFKPRLNMLYVAISRVTSCANLYIRNLPELAAFQDYDSDCMDFTLGKTILSFTEKIARDADSEYINTSSEMVRFTVKESTLVRPREIIYYDYETALLPARESGEHQIKPYLCSYCVENAYSDKMDVGAFCDIKGSSKGGQNVIECDDVVEEFCNRIILPVIRRFENLYGRTKIQTKKKTPNGDPVKLLNVNNKYTKCGKDMRKRLMKEIPVLSAYNGANFDLHFTAMKLASILAMDGEKYTFPCTMKGSSIVNFMVVNERIGACVMRVHDLCQISPASLESNCRSFLSAENKISFHEEILDISNKRYLVWANREWSDYNMKEPLTRTNYTSEKELFREATTTQSDYHPCDVLAYCMQDSLLLPKLYKAMDAVIQNICPGVGVFNYSTLGNLIWSQLLRDAMEVIPYTVKRHRKLVDNVSRVNLFNMTNDVDAFCRRAIYGGRATPRIISSNCDQMKGKNTYFVDITSMYGEILLDSRFPCGKISWIVDNQAHYIEGLYETARECRILGKKLGVHPIHCLASRTDSAHLIHPREYFIADFTFTENQSLIEPIIGEKANNAGMRYALERRTATLTSLDALLVILSGGTIYSMGRGVHFEMAAPYMRPSLQKYIEGKTKYKKTNIGLSTFYKLMGNGSFGQGCRRPFNESYTWICRNKSETESFLRNHEFTNAIPLGQYDVLYGRTRADELTSRNCSIGAFVLSYSRLNLNKILFTANPSQLPYEIITGDTDSLLVSAQAAANLRNTINVETNRPWFPDTALPGELADELADIFQLKAPEGQIAVPCTRFFCPAPKVYAIEVEGPDGKKYYKFRCKGIGKTNQLAENRLLSAGILFSYEDEYMDMINGKKTNATGISASGQSLSKWGLKRAANHPERALTIDGIALNRVILTSPWSGRKNLHDGVTVPYGWCPREEMQKFSQFRGLSLPDLKKALASSTLHEKWSITHAINERAIIISDNALTRYAVRWRANKVEHLIDGEKYYRVFKANEYFREGEIFSSTIKPPRDACANRVFDDDRADGDDQWCEFACACDFSVNPNDFHNDELIFAIDIESCKSARHLMGLVKEIPTERLKIITKEGLYERPLLMPNISIPKVENPTETLKAAIAALRAKYPVMGRPRQIFSKLAEAREYVGENPDLFIIRDETDYNKFKVFTENQLLAFVAHSGHTLHEVVSEEESRFLYFDVDGSTEEVHSRILSAIRYVLDEIYGPDAKMNVILSVDPTKDVQEKISMHVVCNCICNVALQKKIHAIVMALAGVDESILDCVHKSQQNFRMPLTKNAKGRWLIPIDSEISENLITYRDGEPIEYNDEKLMAKFKRPIRASADCMRIYNAISKFGFMPPQRHGKLTAFGRSRTCWCPFCDRNHERIAILYGDKFVCPRSEAHRPMSFDELLTALTTHEAEITKSEGEITGHESENKEESI